MQDDEQNDNPELTEEEDYALEMAHLTERLNNLNPFADDIELVDAINYLWTLWSDFHISVSLPFIPYQEKATIIEPDVDSKTKQVEQVYPIFDYGNKMSTSRGEDLILGHRTMGKLYNTIEKMIGLMVKRIKEHQLPEGGDTQPEARVAFAGHELGQRKAFESVINLEENVVVTNFDPGTWGDKHLQMVKELADRGYGLPKPSPRFKG